MIFQEPMSSLNPTLTCGSQVAEVLQIHTDLNKKEIYNEVITRDIYNRINIRAIDG